MAALKDAYEAKGAYVLLMDAGDFIQGDPTVSVSEGATAAELMTLAGYDVATLGNHEFDYGYENLRKLVMEEMEFAVVAANVRVGGKDYEPYGSSVTFTAPDGTKIGVFGLSTPETATKAHPAKIQGVTFTLEGHTFKASQVDRKFSYGRLTQRIEQNRLRQAMVERVRNYADEQRPQVSAILQKLEAEKQQQLEPPCRNLSIAGKPLTKEQIEMLRDGEPIFVRGTQSEGYVVMDDRLQMAWIYRDDPRDWVEYGKYTMRRMDRDRIEAGYVVRALVKWWGGTTARPYLWKENASDTTYRESWDDPREPRPSQNQKQQDRPRRFITPKKKSRGPSR